MTKAEILRIAQQEQVQFLRLQFTDILGQIKNVEVPSTQISLALDGGMMFDGSSIQGFSRKRELDMVLIPDYDTFKVFPWTEDSGTNKIATIVCDTYYPDGREYEGCPRLALKRVLNECRSLGFEYKIAGELEFFLFRKKADGSATLSTYDSAGYFDITPDDVGEETRRHIVKSLQSMGYKVEGAHHEVSKGQHEIDFVMENAITAADNITGSKFVVRKIASRNNLHATFMPRPSNEQFGSGLHLHQILEKDGENAFYSEKDDLNLSLTAKYFVAGQLKHAPGYCSITNPLINSFKRLIDNLEAPTHVVWSERNTSPLIRIPDHPGKCPRIEHRLPDPTCNSYLAMAVLLKTGLEGIKEKLDPGQPVNKEVSDISYRERARLKIERLPKDLNEALTALKKDRLVQQALGEGIYKNYYSAKLSEWNSYISQIHPWEIEHYFTYY